VLVQWFLTDNIHSIRQVVSASGPVLDAITYDPYGNILSQTNAANAPRFLYAGGAYDSLTGYDQFGRRYYDPSDGRWTSQDPLGFKAGDTDLYRYVFNVPTLSNDPSGEINFSWGNAISGAGYGAVGGAIGGAAFGPGAGLSALAGGIIGFIYGGFYADSPTEAAIGGFTLGVAGPVLATLTLCIYEAVVGWLGLGGAAAQQEAQYIESNGFYFSQYYWQRLWETGRIAPGYRAQWILEGTGGPGAGLPDPKVGRVSFCMSMKDGK
jgi:RHS repeat-associated protein